MARFGLMAMESARGRIAGGRETPDTMILVGAHADVTRVEDAVGRIADWTTKLEFFRYRLRRSLAIGEGKGVVLSMLPDRSRGSM